MSDVKFWHNHIGNFLPGSPDESKSSSVMVPHRTNKGVKPLRLGAIEAIYFGSEDESFVIGRIEMPSTEKLKNIQAEDVSAKKYLATYLIQSARAPFICGSIGNASPVSSFEMTHELSRSVFCEAGKSIRFDLNLVREAHKKFSPFDWKKDVAPLIYVFESYINGNNDEREKAKAKLQKASPELRDVISSARIKPHSGEYAILSWSNIESK